MKGRLFIMRSIPLLLHFLYCIVGLDGLKNSPHHLPCLSLSDIKYASNTDGNVLTSVDVRTRREVISRIASGTFSGVYLIPSNFAYAGTLTPGGSIVDREVGVTVGNSEASASRENKNGNVLFQQDYYFKFGTAAPWIEPDSTEFPKSMPFILTQQRYDFLKKYGFRVQTAIKLIDGLAEVIKMSPSPEQYALQLKDPLEPEYGLRPMGLLANGMLSSDNTGLTNELLLARWYINEISLQVSDIRVAKSETDALSSYLAAKKAVNSYLSILNRQITAKVGNQFTYLSI